MITFKTNRDKVRTVYAEFFKYINLYKQSKLNDLAHFHIMSEEYLTAITINCLLSEIEELLHKKLVNTTSVNIKVALTNAQGVLLYRMFLALPLPQDNYYYQLIRNEWIQQLDAEIIREGINQARPKAHRPAGDFSYLDD